MIIVIRKRWIFMTAAVCCITFLGGAVLLEHQIAEPVFSVLEAAPLTVVLDPGHGGEDGGAVSPDGVKESGLNLEIALRLQELLRFSGVKTQMTRMEDVSIHQEEARTIQEKKVSDLHRRVEIVNGIPGAMLLSVHQNSLPSSVVTYGAQAFWNQQTGAEGLAVSIQNALNQAINTHRAKEAKPIASTIYLMRQITVPGVLVECGFLSNPEETLRLQQSDHQCRLAVAITAGFFKGLSEGNGS